MTQVLLRPFAVVFLVALALTARGQSSPPGRSAPADQKWTDRLEQLRPQDALAYFELAEEIADVAPAGPERDLARHLFALAGALEPERLGRSAALALADLEADATAKRRLLALASLLRSNLGPALGAQMAGARSPETGGSAALAAAEALSYYRVGEGAKAATALKTPGAEDVLRTYDRVLPGGYNRFIEDCKLYRAGRAPTLSSTDVTRLLRLEAALLAGAARSWSSDLLLTGGQPLIEVDPDHLAETFGIDIARSVYRNGRWVEP